MKEGGVEERHAKLLEEGKVGGVFMFFSHGEGPGLREGLMPLEGTAPGKPV